MSRSKYKQKKTDHRTLISKEERLHDSSKRDTKLFSVFLNPTKVFQAVRHVRRSALPDVRKLHVGDRIYEGEEVSDGFYDSISNLKTKAHQNLSSSVQRIFARYVSPNPKFLKSLWRRPRKLLALSVHHLMTSTASLVTTILMLVSLG